ncbi:hypothetical protein [Roseovarius tolerans]|nr:hypothetical protein [Roseovarius tolerans]
MAARDNLHLAHGDQLEMLLDLRLAVKANFIAAFRPDEHRMFAEK